MRTNLTQLICSIDAELDELSRMHFVFHGMRYLFVVVQPHESDSWNLALLRRSHVRLDGTNPSLNYEWWVPLHTHLLDVENLCRIDRPQLLCSARELHITVTSKERDFEFSFSCLHVDTP